jgi:molecular chaperone GrpE
VTQNETQTPNDERAAGADTAEVVDLGEEATAEAAATAADTNPQESQSDADRLAELHDRFLRQAAELENFKKRTEREADRRVRRERENVILEWLPVVDSLERAIGFCSEADAAVAEGIRKVLEQAESVLKARGIGRMQSDGALFDSSLHEALTTIPSPAHENGAVLHTERAGYLREDGTVLRPARVVVVKNG